MENRKSVENTMQTLNGINKDFEQGMAKSQTSAINIIFDGPPSPESGRFVEVENDEGKSISIGEWIEREDGFWALRIESL